MVNCKGEIVMNKKVLVIIVALVVIVIAIIIEVLLKAKNESSNDVDYEIIKDGYSSYESKIISNYQEYMEFVDYIDLPKNMNDFYSNKYNKKYFNNKSLAIINIVTGSSMNRLNNIYISITGNLLVCKVDIDHATGIATADITGKVLLIEIDKSVTKFKIENQ